MKFISKELEYFLSDLSEEYKNELISIVEDKNPKNRYETDLILSKFRKDKGFIKVGKFTSKYWEQRGWNKKDSEEKKKKSKINNIPNGSPMQIKYWTNRTNEKTGFNYTEEEAIYKIRSQRKFNIEYWIEKGFTEEDAKLKIKETQSKNSSKRNNYSGVTWNQYEYWMKKENITEKEAKEKVSHLQNTFDINRIIKKYGEIEGIKRYEQMCKNLGYSQTLNGFIERYGYELGNKKYEETIIKRCSNSSVSIESILFFKKIYKKIRLILKREEIYWGIKGSKEYFLYDNELKKIFFYDFTIPSLKIIIEYHGKRYHPNPKWDYEKWKKWSFLGMSADEKRKMDEYKNNIAIKMGFDVIEIFYDDIKENTHDKLSEIIIEKFLKNACISILR
jgi:very-short-patch-repair endonuclease